jgi:phosphoserine phosphatase RsbU/P
MQKILYIIWAGAFLYLISGIAFLFSENISTSLSSSFIKYAEIFNVETHVLIFFALCFEFGLFLFFIAFVFQKYYISHLKKIIIEMKKLMKGKKYALIPLSKRKDEIGITGVFFNKITQSLERISKNIKKGYELENDLSIATTIQADLMPKKPLITEDLEIAARSKSATEIGGDSFNYMYKKNDVFFYIGDVTGHGIPAALVMTMVDTLIQSYVEICKRSHDVITEVNRHLFKKIASNMFMSLIMFHWDDAKNKLYYSGAGHENILIYRKKEKKVIAQKTGGIALGMIPDIKNIAKENAIQLEDGDFFILYTDGITEARNAKNEMYGIDRLVESINKYCSPGAKSEHIFNAITREFSHFVGQGYEQADDITLIVVKKRHKGENNDTLELEEDIDNESVNSVWN